MKAEIDQSGKVEDTARDTILCISNDRWHAVRIDRHTKRRIQEVFRRHGQTRNFVLFTFTAGLALLFRFSKVNTSVVVDREYFGHEAVIINILHEMIPEETFPLFTFGHLRNKSLAHHRAYAVGLGKLSAHRILTYAQVLRQIKKTEVGKRLKNA